MKCYDSSEEHNTKQKRFRKSASCLNQNMISKTKYESRKPCYIST